MQTETTPINRDVLIIGAGPVGLFAVFQCGMLGLSCAVVDALPEIGGQCSALYPEKPIYDIPAFAEISAAELVSNLEAQIAPFKPSYHLSQEAQHCRFSDNNFEVITDKGSRFIAKAIIIAAGAGAFGPNRPPLADIEQYEGKSVFYVVKRRQDFAHKNIAIAGGGDSAVDWCLSLSEIAEKIYFIHRRDKFRAAPESVQRLLALAETDKVDIIVPYQPAALQGDGGMLRSLTVRDLDGNEKTLTVDVFLAFFGLANSLKAFDEWGLGIEHGRIPVNSLTQATTHRSIHKDIHGGGIYAIGDGCVYEGKLKLILQGFSEAATAAHSAYRFIYPDKAIHFEHSTTKFADGGVKSPSDE